MFEDVYSRVYQKLERNRTPGADFDEVTCADDTTCISTDSRTMNRLIQQIAEEGFRCGLPSNKHECELITALHNANKHFGDKAEVPKVRLATYLGCRIRTKTNSKEELSQTMLSAGSQ